MSLQARYSIVRYVEDIERGETINVGILLESGDGMVIGRFVDRESLSDPGVVRRFRGTIEIVLREGREASLDDLAARQFGHFRLTEPRAVVVEDDPPAALESLVNRLVAAPQHALAT
jgi:hypothetical protein